MQPRPADYKLKNLISLIINHGEVIDICVHLKKKKKGRRLNLRMACSVFLLLLVLYVMLFFRVMNEMVSLSSIVGVAAQVLFPTVQFPELAET